MFTCIACCQLWRPNEERRGERTPGSAPGPTLGNEYGKTTFTFTHKIAVKTSWHRYGTKLRHYHPVYRKNFFLPVIPKLVRCSLCYKTLQETVHRTPQDTLRLGRQWRKLGGLRWHPRGSAKQWKVFIFPFAFHQLISVSLFYTDVISMRHINASIDIKF